MKIVRLLPLLIPALCLYLEGCSTLPLSGRLPDNLTVERLTAVSAHSPVALSPDGTAVAYPDHGLKMLRILTRERVEISAQTPRRLAWSPLGSRLAALYGDGAKSTVITYDRDGKKSAATELDGEISALAWLSETELLAAALVITDYRFGSNCKSVLHRWQPGGSLPTTTVLRDTTLKPATAKHRHDQLVRGPMLDVARPDHILYLHPFDPPLFPPYYKLILRDLASGRELELGSLDLGSDGGRFIADGERIVYGDGAGKTVILNPWTGEIAGTIGIPGKGLDVSPGGDYLYADGSLYRGTTLVAPLAPGGTARFTQDGRRLVIAAEGSLYLLAGFPPAGEGPIPAAAREKLRRLRSWRVEQLIAPKEYQDALERMKQP